MKDVLPADSCYFFSQVGEQLFCEARPEARPQGIGRCQPEMHLAGRKAIYARVQLIRLTANLVAEQSKDKRDLSC